MTEITLAEQRLSVRLDKAMATTLATADADDRYFIGEALLAAVALFLLNRYAGAYLDRLGLKPLAEKHADATKLYLDAIRRKVLTAPATAAAREELLGALTAIRDHGRDAEARRVAAQLLAEELVEAGAFSAQARDVAIEVADALDAELDARDASRD